MAKTDVIKPFSIVFRMRALSAFLVGLTSVLRLSAANWVAWIESDTNAYVGMRNRDHPTYQGRDGAGNQHICSRSSD